MDHVDAITILLGDTDKKRSFQIKIKDKIKSRYGLNQSEKLRFYTFEKDKGLIVCKIYSKTKIFEFKIKINDVAGHFEPEFYEDINLKERELIYLVLVGNGLSRMLVNKQDAADPISTENICEKAFENLQELKEFFGRIRSSQNLDYEDKIGLLYDLITHSPASNDNLLNEYEQFIKKAVKIVYDITKNIKIQEHEHEFCDFIQTTLPHIATLNYDNILYSYLFAQSVNRNHYSDGLVGEKGKIISFNPTFLRKKLVAKSKFYLHLHGSCLFIRNGTNIEKKTKSDFENNSEKNPPLIVLTSAVKKYSIVHDSHQFSFILHAYNRILEWSLKGCDKLLIIGYGAKDAYLNESITQALLLNKKEIDIAFIETHKEKKHENFEKLKNFIKESPIDAKSANNIIQKMQFNYFADVNWKNVFEE